MADISKIYKQRQLKSKEDTFDIAQTLFQQVNNEYWREKSNLWHIISAACNDAAGEFYVKLKEYVKNLADIDVCTIHNLKSIAQSVDAPHLLDFANTLQTFPVELRELMDMLSIKPSKLLEANQKLHYLSILPLLGNIDIRSCLIRPQDLSLTLLIDIFDNIEKIEKWFNYNRVLPNHIIRYIFNQNKNDTFSDQFLTEAKLYNEGLEEESTIWYYGYNELIDADKEGYYQVVYTTLEEVLNLSVKDVLNNIKYLKQIIEQNESDLNKGTQLSQLLGFEFKFDEQAKNIKQYIVNTFNTNSIVVYKNGKYIFNPFFALIEIVKARVYANQINPFLSYYKEIGDNEVTIDMSTICQNIVETIKNNDKCYIRNFMFFHIYHLLYSKIINDKLRDDFLINVKVSNNQNNIVSNSDAQDIYDWNKQTLIDINKITYNSKYSELTYDQFYPAISSWISNNELKEFLGQKIDQDTLDITDFKQVEINKVEVSHYKKEYIDFIQYLSLVRAITRQNNEQRQLPYLIYRYNNYINDKTTTFNQYKRNLLGINEDGTYNADNYIQKVAEYLTDICIKISYIRQQIKALVQQYSFIGTQRIVTDVVRDYFVKNFAKRSSWRYISDKFKNKDNTNSIKPLDSLNGLNGNKQFTAQLVQYFDQTAYLNIETDLPPTINGYTEVLTTFPSTYIVTEETISTWILDEDRVSTIYDNFDFQIPSSLYPQPSIVTSFTQPGVTISGTSLYSDLIAYSAAGVDKSNVSTVDVTDSYITTADPDEQNMFEFISTPPQSTAIADNRAKSILYRHIANIMGQDVLESVSGSLTNIEVGTKTGDNGVTYYFVTADMEKTTFKTVTSSVTTTNQVISTPPLDNSNVLSTLSFPASKSITLAPEKTITGQFYNPAQSSFIIPSGTPVSTVLQPGEQITVNVTSTIYVPNWVDGNDLVEKSNPRFWQKNIEYLGWADLSTQIGFYQKYFPELQNAPTDEIKMQIYKDQVYPLLTEIWDKNATSGMLDGQNDRIHQQYSGQYPGKQKERNIGNQDFTTIAPLPYIPNLIPVNTYDNDDSYIVKPLYDNISYYMNMFMTQMFNMYRIQADNGFAIAIDGWKQTHIEMKGYCSKYERSANTIATEGQMNSKLDYDGPWVYSSLKDFLALEKNGQISKEDIDWYVDNYFFNVERGSENIKNKLFKYYKDIKRLGNLEEQWKLYSFEFDVNDNQYTLFKRKDYFKYEDAGQIWVRMKNFPLSMPLMNRNVVIDFKDVRYQNDPYDTLLCNERVNYANMLKQMTNNAVQFGVIKNTMWILGWTNYSLNSSKRLTWNKVDKMLRLISFNFKVREDFNLIVDQLSFQSYSISLQNDKLNNFNQFVGVNYREKDDTIDFILYDKDRNKIVIYNSSDPTVPVDENLEVAVDDVALQIEQIEALKNTAEVPSSLQLGQTYIINGLDNNDINIGTVYYNKDRYIISGYGGRKQRYSIYEQMLTGVTNAFEYLISSAEFPAEFDTYINLLSCNKDYKKQVYDTPLSSLHKLPSTAYNILTDLTFTPLVNLNEDVNQNLFEAQTTISSYANVWRVNADENNTGIAYESYDFTGKEQLSSLFLLRKENVQNQKTVKNIFTISSNLITKQVIDSNNNIVYMNQIESISTALSTAAVYLEDNNDNDYIAIQQMFPYCHLTRDNKLVISSLVTTLGSYKSLTVDKEQKNVYQNPNGWQLLKNTIDPDIVCNDTFEDIITDSNSYFYRNGQRIELDDQFDNYLDLLPNITGSYDFYEYYDKYIEAKQNNQPLSTQKEYLQMYNEQMAKLNNIIAFAPVVNEFIIEPLKIIFNFGNMFSFDINAYNPNKTNYFDLDINTYINTPEEKYKKVGWKAGLWQTDYITWVTRDQRFGSPEIVVVDIEKYKNDNINSYKMNLKDYSIDIIVNACWFAESVIQSLNPSIFVNWKGFTYHYMIEDIETNQNACDFPFVKIRVGLNNNTLRCYRKVLIPVCLFNKHNNEKLFGFIRMWEDEEFDGYVRTSYQTDDWQIKIALTDDTTFRSYQQFEAACDNEEQALRMLNLVGIYGEQQANKLKQSLKWNKTLILKVDEDKQLEFHIKKIII